MSIACPKCGAAINATMYNQPSGPCSGCRSALTVAAFASLISGPAQNGAGQLLVDAEQASCFYHPGKKASVPCDNCGRFLCSLCDIDFGGKSLCPACIETHGTRNSSESLDTHRFLYDKLAITLAIIPTIVTQLAVLFMALKYWTSPITIPPRSKLRWRWILAVIVAVVWLWLLVSWIIRIW